MESQIKLKAEREAVRERNIIRLLSHKYITVYKI